MKGSAISCIDALSLLRSRPDSGESRWDLEEHLSSCAACTEYCTAQAVLDRDLAHALVTEPPAWLSASILEQLTVEKPASWWTRPAWSLALQWSFYLALGSMLIQGFVAPLESLAGMPQSLLTWPAQIGVAFEVLTAVLGLVPIDSVTSVIDDTAWIYQAAALVLVCWWLRSGSDVSDSRTRA
ncbi:MAG: hypothetical protein ACKVVP_14890 [Chloroflexota bacterium]